jgi:hypothetical protein
MSYAYAPLEKYFEKTWEAQMRLFLAGNPSQKDSIQGETLPLVENHLTTFADPLEAKNKSKYFDCRSNILIDSGAFTAFTKNKAIKPEDYAEWALGFRGRWQDKSASLHFMNLDVIGDQDASWSNQARIEAMGLKILPIVTYGADVKHIDRALEYPYFALGGLVPYAQQPGILKPWVMPRVHILGITRDWVCERYPLFSCDSSTWTQVLRFGGAQRSGLKKVPRYKEGAGALAANVEELIASIRFYQEMERNATNLWDKRGIRFE